MPIERNGQNIDDITLNGNAIDEVTVNGDTVFTAIPDSDMFQNPIYQWWAGFGINVADGQTATNWEDGLAGINASAVGSPTYRADQSGFEAVEYNGTNEGHNWSGNANLPTGDETWAFAALGWLKSGSGIHNVVGWGDTDSDGRYIALRFEDGQVGVEISGIVVPKTGSNLEGSWVTIGGRYDQSNVTPYANGFPGTAASISSLNVQAENESLGYRRTGNDFFGDVYLAEVIVCADAESDQAFSNYHSNRLD